PCGDEAVSAGAIFPHADGRSVRLEEQGPTAVGIRDTDEVVAGCREGDDRLCGPLLRAFDDLVSSDIFEPIRSEQTATEAIKIADRHRRGDPVTPRVEMEFLR